MTVGPDLHVLMFANFLQLCNVHKVIKSAFGKGSIHIFFGFNIRQLLAGKHRPDFAGFNKGCGDKIGELFRMILK